MMGESVQSNIERLVYTRRKTHQKSQSQHIPLGNDQIETLSEGVVRSLGSGRWSNWTVLDALGTAGGILVCWDKRSLEVMETETGIVLWEELGAIRGLWEEPWCIGGDFNVILSNKKGGALPLGVGEGITNPGQARQVFGDPAVARYVQVFSGGGGKGIEARGRASFRLAYKMKVVKQIIKVWNREVFGKVEVNKNSALQQLEHWDGVESERRLSMAEAEQKKKPRMLFINGNNSLDRITINGEMLTEDQEVREGIVNAFQNLLSEEPGWRADIEGLQLKQLNSREAENLEEEVMELFKEFFEYGSFAKSLNTTFWSLFPKKGGSSEDGIWVSVGGMDEVVYFYCKFFILINGVPAGFFSNSKGLRQGDPLSPYLFVLGMEVLSTMISRAGEGGFISGSRREQLTNLSWILAWFEAASGLRINLAKSVLIPVGEVDGMEELAAELGCKLGALPAVYLGLPLGANHKNASSWDGVEERMRRRLAQWKRQYISKGGRITLIKSTLASIPIYLLSLIRIPKVVAKRIEKIQRDFLWEGGSLEGKVHLINWQVVCSPKEEGGLGIRKIELLNKTLLGKWVWRYAYEKDNLWKKAIGVKYGQEGCGWRTKEVCGPYGVGLWKEIMEEAEWCWESMDLKVGKGNRVLFWMDKWCGNEALSQTFPQLFTLAGYKNAKVCEVWDSSLGQGGWNLSLARDLNDWEIDQIGEMLNLLKDFRISQEEDSVRWKREGNGVFGAKGAYRSLSGYSVVVKTIWEITLVIFGVQWVFPESVIEERNRIVFRGGSLDIQKFKNSFVCNLWGWAKVYIGEETYSLLGNPTPNLPSIPVISSLDLDIPIALRKALDDPNWKVAVMEEMNALKRSSTWVLVDLHKEKRTETFAPVAKINSTRILLSLAVNFNWLLHQLDIKNAFLNGDLEEEVFMNLPPGFEEKLRSNQADHTMFYKDNKDGKIAILIVYVDDIVLIGSDKEELERLKRRLAMEFEINDLGALKQLGCKPAETPIEPNIKLLPSKDDEVKDKEQYQRLVRRLIYLSHTRPDIAFAVSMVSQFLHAPGQQHFNVVYRILSYLKGSLGREPRKLLETPGAIYTKPLEGRVWKVLEMPRDVRTSLHYGGRHERSPRLSREF
ncbi:Retrovirus-related Pol polyprotein from transposon RE1 [Vitis vinifera]|uniref:Retrovirus-related Pol polyprotein from transposon RE1 n=1 Tax=Vitis vinifera TaxID=29760 RepID=A0A438EQL8_VITVI|nr:Retrovirus-related Pol polyprotein from transposon RE1 [Vitis vinifera]